MQHTFKADKECRLSEFLREKGVSRSLVCTLKQHEGAISVNGQSVHTDYHLKAGDMITLTEPKETDSGIIKTAEPKVPVLYEDGEVIVFDKPPLMPCHPSVKHIDDTLANYCAYITDGAVFRCINRLDRDTSGCCLVAKSRYCAGIIGKSIKKRYIALAQGAVNDKGVIEKPIRRKGESIIERECADDGQYAKTLYKTIARNDKYSLCEVTLETGRTHQIRVHFSYIGHPLAGDDMYGGSPHEISRQALHCASLEFITPDGGKRITVTSPLPEDIRRLIY